MAWWLRLGAALPPRVTYAFCGSLAWLLRHVLRYRVAIARDNLRGCFPHWQPAAIEATLDALYVNLGQVAAEFLMLAGLSASELRARVRLRNPEIVNAELQQGRSVMVAGAHHGNWEWLLQSLVLDLAAPMDCAYKPLHSAAADAQLRLVRTRFGGRMVMAKRLLREIARRRGTATVIGLLADQVPASADRRLWLTFLGRDTAFYPGPGQIAQSTGYAAYFPAIRRLRRGYYEAEFQPLCAASEKISAEEFTRRYAAACERQVLASPSDWMWTHRRWKIVREPTVPAGTG